MSNGELHVVGGIPNDPEIRQAIADYETSDHSAAAKALTSPMPHGFERWGIKLRTPGLMHSAMITRVMAGREVPTTYQPFIYIFTLGADLEKVYAALDLLDKKGMPSFMALIHGWWEACGIPQGVTQDVLDAVAETFELANKLAPQAPQDDESTEAEVNDVLKKNVSRGLSQPQTGLPANTDGLGT
jgi:hypothetical protein